MRIPRVSIAKPPLSYRGVHARDLGERLTVWAVWLVLLGGLVREVLGQTAMADLGAYTFHTTDPAVIAMLLAVLANGARGRFDWQPYALPVIAIAGLIAANFVRGMLVDPDPALLWLRANGATALLPLLALTMRPGSAPMRAARRALLLCAVVLSALLLVRLVFGASLWMTADVTDLTANDGGRALSSPGALLLVLASVMLASEVLRRRSLRIDGTLLLACALPVAILLTRQGTAIVAEFAALGAVLLLQRSSMQGWRIVFAGLGAIALLALLVAFLPALTETTDLQRRLGTLYSRQEIWSSLSQLWPTLPLSTQVFGFAAGQQPVLQVYLSGFYQYWSLSIHSMYFGALPMMGFAGAFAFVTLLALLTWKSLRGALAHAEPLPAFPFAACLATGIIGYSYELRNDMLVGLFMAIWWLRATSRQTGQASMPATAHGTNRPQLARSRRPGSYRTLKPGRQI